MDYGEHGVKLISSTEGLRSKHQIIKFIWPLVNVVHREKTNNIK